MENTHIVYPYFLLISISIAAISSDKNVLTWVSGENNWINTWNTQKAVAVKAQLISTAMLRVVSSDLSGQGDNSGNPHQITKIISIIYLS